MLDIAPNPVLSPLGQLPSDVQKIFVARRMHDAMAPALVKRKVAQSYAQTKEALNAGDTFDAFQKTIKTCSYAGAGLGTLAHCLLDVPFGKGYSQRPVKFPQETDSEAIRADKEQRIKQRRQSEEGLLGKVMMLVGAGMGGVGYVAGALGGVAFGVAGAGYEMFAAAQPDKTDPLQTFKNAVTAGGEFGRAVLLSCYLGVHGLLEMGRIATGVFRAATCAVAGAAGAVLGIAVGTVMAAVVFTRRAAGSVGESLEASLHADEDEAAEETDDEGSVLSHDERMEALFEPRTPAAATVEPADEAEPADPQMVGIVSEPEEMQDANHLSGSDEFNANGSSLAMEELASFRTPELFPVQEREVEEEVDSVALPVAIDVMDESSERSDLLQGANAQSAGTETFATHKDKGKRRVIDSEEAGKANTRKSVGFGPAERIEHGII